MVILKFLDWCRNDISNLQCTKEKNFYQSMLFELARKNTIPIPCGSEAFRNNIFVSIQFGRGMLFIGECKKIVFNIEKMP